MNVCDDCGAEVYDVRKHETWHEVHSAQHALLHAHQENLIERVYALEGGDNAEVCYACNGSGIGRTGDTASMCDTCGGSGWVTP